MPCEIPQGCPQAYDETDKQDHKEEIWWALLILPQVARRQRASVPTAMICGGFMPTPESEAGADTLPHSSMTVAHTRHCYQSQVGWGMLQVHPTCNGERSGAQGVLGAQSCVDSHGHGAEALNSVELAPGKTKCLTVSKEKQYLIPS